MLAEPDAQPVDEGREIALPCPGVEHARLTTLHRLGARGRKHDFVDAETRVDLRQAGFEEAQEMGGIASGRGRADPDRERAPIDTPEDGIEKAKAEPTPGEFGA